MEEADIDPGDSPSGPRSKGFRLGKEYRIGPDKMGLSFIAYRQRRNEGTFSASELAGIEPTPPASKVAGYVCLDHLATIGPESSRSGSWACSWLSVTPEDGKQRPGALEEADIDPGDKAFRLGKGYPIWPGEL